MSASAMQGGHNYCSKPILQTPHSIPNKSSLGSKNRLQHLSNCKPSDSCQQKTNLSLTCMISVQCHNVFLVVLGTFIQLHSPLIPAALQAFLHITKITHNGPKFHIPFQNLQSVGVVRILCYFTKT